MISNDMRTSACNAMRRQRQHLMTSKENERIYCQSITRRTIEATFVSYSDESRSMQMYRE
eukprot:scaffold67_cov192-Alexandrium_tamarense.AAC.25